MRAWMLAVACGVFLVGCSDPEPPAPVDGGPRAQAPEPPAASTTNDAPAVLKDPPPGYSSLHAAAEAGDADRIKALLAEGTLVDIRNEQTGETPLHLAAASGRAEAVAALLAAGADRTARTREGDTPADLAHRGGHHATARQLDPGPEIGP